MNKVSTPAFKGIEHFPEGVGLPVVLFLHGIGERGDGSEAALQSLYDFINSEYNNIKKALESIFTQDGKQQQFALVAPQLPANLGNWENSYVDAAYSYILSKPGIDPSRIAIAGVSLGGGGVWKYISHSIDNARKFNVAIVVCGVGGWSSLKNIADAGLPVWAFHANDDTVVGVGNTNSAVSGINQYNPAIPARKTLYPTGGHFIWGTVFNPDATPGNSGETATVWQWMLMNTKDKHVPVPTSPASTPALVADAGPDITITGTTATLDGSASKGYKAAWWLLESVNGKWSGSNFFDGTNYAIKAKLKNLAPGEYVYKLVVADGATMVNDTVKLTVKGTTEEPPPVKQEWAKLRLKSGKQLIVFEDDTTEIK